MSPSQLTVTSSPSSEATVMFNMAGAHTLAERSASPFRQDLARITFAMLAALGGRGKDKQGRRAAFSPLVPTLGVGTHCKGTPRRCRVGRAQRDPPRRVLSLPVGLAALDPPYTAMYSAT